MRGSTMEVEPMAGSPSLWSARPPSASLTGCSWRELRERVSISSLLEAAGKLGQLRACGRRLVGPCPIHAGDNPNAFTVDPHRGLWYCFTRCRTGGDTIALAWYLCGRSWPQAATWLCQLAGQLPEPHPLNSHIPSQIDACARPFRPFTRSLRLDASHPFVTVHGNAVTQCGVPAESTALCDSVGRP